MMQSEGKITRENAFEIIKKFAAKYRKMLGRTPAEIIIVGGGSIMLNYKFRDATQDFDVILKEVSGINDVIAQFADENDLPRDWMNTDFMKTPSYTATLREISTHYSTLNNGTLEIRTVSGVYLIAMKIKSRRNYRNDISDVSGILIEEYENGNPINSNMIFEAYRKLYNEEVSSELAKFIRELCLKNIDDLKAIYAEKNKEENEIGTKVISYIDDGAKINAENVETVVAKIKERMKSN